MKKVEKKSAKGKKAAPVVTIKSEPVKVAGSKTIEISKLEKLANYPISLGSSLSDYRDADFFIKDVEDGQYLIEVVAYPKKDKYVVLRGSLAFDAAVELELKEVRCLVVDIPFENFSMQMYAFSEPLNRQIRYRLQDRYKLAKEYLPFEVEKAKRRKLATLVQFKGPGEAPAVDDEHGKSLDLACRKAKIGKSTFNNLKKVEALSPKYVEDACTDGVSLVLNYLQTRKAKGVPSESILDDITAPKEKKFDVQQTSEEIIKMLEPIKKSGKHLLDKITDLQFTRGHFLKLLNDEMMEELEDTAATFNAISKALSDRTAVWKTWRNEENRRLRERIVKKQVEEAHKKYDIKAQIKTAPRNKK